MKNTIVSKDGLEIQIDLLIQFPVPNVFDQCQTEEQVDSFSSAFSALLKKEYKVEGIFVIKGANNIKGKDIVACLMGLSWFDGSAGFKYYRLNLLWFQEGFAFPINPDIMHEIKKLRFDIVGIEDEIPF